VCVCVCAGKLLIKSNARQSGVAFQILQNLEESVFTEEVKEEVSEQEAMFMVCRAIHGRKDSLLPTVTHDIEATVESLISAISQHYKESGFPLRGKTLAELKKGYFEANDSGGKVVTTILDTTVDGEGGADSQVQGKVALNFEYADEAVKIENPLDVTTRVTVKVGGRATSIDSLAQEFQDRGIDMPKTEVDWKGELAEKKKVPATPVKKGKSGTPDKNEKASSSSTSAKPLSQAIMRRLSPMAKSPLKKAKPNP
jgi:hypothetical protein